MGYNWKMQEVLGFLNPNPFPALFLVSLWVRSIKAKNSFTHPSSKLLLQKALNHKLETARFFRERFYTLDERDGWNCSALSPLFFLYALKRTVISGSGTTLLATVTWEIWRTDQKALEMSYQRNWTACCILANSCLKSSVVRKINS